MLTIPAPIMATPSTSPLGLNSSIPTVVVPLGTGTRGPPLVVGVGSVTKNFIWTMPPGGADSSGMCSETCRPVVVLEPPLVDPDVLVVVVVPDPPLVDPDVFDPDVLCANSAGERNTAQPKTTWPSREWISKVHLLRLRPAPQQQELAAPGGLQKPEANQSCISNVVVSGIERADFEKESLRRHNSLANGRRQINVVFRGLCFPQFSAIYFEQAHAVNRGIRYPFPTDLSGAFRKIARRTDDREFAGSKYFLASFNATEWLVAGSEL